MPCGGFLPWARRWADGLQDSYRAAVVASVICVGYFRVNSSGVTVTEYNEKKPVQTRRESVKERLRVLYNVLIS